jgi:hypothetical protein
METLRPRTSLRIETLPGPRPTYIVRLDALGIELAVFVEEEMSVGVWLVTATRALLWPAMTGEA